MAASAPSGHRVRYWIGTSGYNYPEWKGPFYPRDLPAEKMLAYYARQFASVEINSTFYRMPTERTVAAWAAATPPGFAFTLKAPRRITHEARLRAVDEPVGRFVEVARHLDDKLGALLFQLPPSFQIDLDAIEGLLALLPRTVRVALEFRHPSWHTAEVFDCLRRHGAALCVADSGQVTTPMEVTADHAYFRLRDEGYRPRDLARWARLIAERTAHCRDVFVYFKHEAQGKGPEFARRLMQELGLSWGPPEVGASPVALPARSTRR
jgi:uncharacterized protein YecE (DUF72 family)